MSLRGGGPGAAGDPDRGSGVRGPRPGRASSACWSRCDRRRRGRGRRGAAVRGGRGRAGGRRQDHPFAGRSPPPWDAPTWTPAPATGPPTLVAMMHRVDLSDEAAVMAAAAGAGFDYEDGAMLVEGVDVSRAIRSEAVTAEVSQAAALAGLRLIMAGWQRRWLAARGGRGVVEGRDIGTGRVPRRRPEGVPDRPAGGEGRPAGRPGRHRRGSGAGGAGPPRPPGLDPGVLAAGQGGGRGGDRRFRHERRGGPSKKSCGCAPNGASALPDLQMEAGSPRRRAGLGRRIPGVARRRPGSPDRNYF